MMRNRSAPLKGTSRREETRDPAATTQDQYLSFSFRYFKNNDAEGQSLEDWAANGLTDSLITRLHHLSTTNITELQTQKCITNYKEFPPTNKTFFSCPPDISKKENWGVIRNIGGQKKRVAGFFKGNIFYIVFLDKEHRFWPSDT